MTTKTFSQSKTQGKMGRNPFAAPKILATSQKSGKSALKLSTKPLAPSPAMTRSKPVIDSSGTEGFALLTAILLPYRGIVLGIKSLLVARYVLTHPKELF